MPDPLEIFLSGVTLGLSIAAPPGPVTALSAQQAVSRSWLAGWQVMLGATLSDAIFFVMAYYGVARLVTPGERDLLFVLGGLLMLYLAFSILRNARRRQDASAPRRESQWWLSSSSIRRFPFLLGLSMGLTNPYQLGWWIAIGAGMIAAFGGSIAVGFFVGILSWTVIFTAVVHAGVKRYERLSPLIAYASAALIAAFALWFLGVGLASTIP
jgi:threonine/homoserine/homoserine lactone efflux protein